MSGGGVLAATIDKPATILLPDNVSIESAATYPWIFKECKFVRYFHREKYI